MSHGTCQVQQVTEEWRCSQCLASAPEAGMGHTLAVRRRPVPERAWASGYLVRGHLVLQVNESRVQGIKGWRKEQMRGE